VAAEEDEGYEDMAPFLGLVRDLDQGDPPPPQQRNRLQRPLLRLPLPPQRLVELAAKRFHQLSGRRRDAGWVVQEEVTPPLPAALEPPPPDESPVERRNDALSQPVAPVHLGTEFAGQGLRLTVGVFRSPALAQVALLLAPPVSHPQPDSPASMSPQLKPD